MTNEHTIAALCARSDANARARGFVDDANPRPFYSSIILLHSELSEALEDFRAHRGIDEVYYEYNNNGVVLRMDGNSTAYSEMTPENRATLKPCGIPIELADFVIRVCQECGTAGKGQELHVAFITAAYDDNDLTCFEQMLAEAHRFTSLAYSAVSTKTGDGVDQLGTALYIVFMFCKKNHIDLWAAIDEKAAFNLTRSHKHGGKKL
jgi:hypothetical protein